MPEAAPADAEPGAAAVEEGAIAAIVDEDDLHHHGNWVGVICRYNSMVNKYTPVSGSRAFAVHVDDVTDSTSAK